MTSRRLGSPGKDFDFMTHPGIETFMIIHLIKEKKEGSTHIMLMS